MHTARPAGGRARRSRRCPGRRLRRQEPRPEVSPVVIPEAHDIGLELRSRTSDAASAAAFGDLVWKRLTCAHSCPGRSVPPASLRLIDGQVRASEDLCVDVSVARERAMPTSCGDAQCAWTDRCAHCEQSKFGARDGGIEVRRGKQYDELLAARPIDRAGHAKYILKASGDLYQHRVAGCMAIGVVEALEVIEIEVDHHDGPGGLESESSARRLPRPVSGSVNAYSSARRCSVLSQRLRTRPPTSGDRAGSHR